MNITLELIVAIIFFASAGVNYLSPNRVLTIIAGVSAIVIAILLILGRGL